MDAGPSSDRMCNPQSVRNFSTNQDRADSRSKLSSTHDELPDCGGADSDVPPRQITCTSSLSFKNDVHTGDDMTADSWEFTIASATATARRSSRTLAKGPEPLPPRNSLVRRSSFQRRLTAQFTVNKLQFMNLGRLYGRERECNRLKAIWEDVHTARATSINNENDSSICTPTEGVRRFVAITGESGTGKTALAETLRVPVSREGGFFLRGKFPQYHRLSRLAGAPFAAFASVCSELCEIVLSLYASTASSSQDSDDSFYCEEETSLSRRYLKFTLSAFREGLNQELAEDASILVRLIPGLMLLLKTDREAVQSPSLGLERESGGYRDVQQQFKIAFRNFLRAVARFGPVVLFLDDMQWADAASMELLEALISDRESNGFMVIGCFQDNSAYWNRPHVTSLKSIQKMSTLDPGLTIELIVLGNLDASQTSELLVDLLSLAEVEALKLAECVHKKTQGNIFYIIQYIKLLKDMELLEYNIGALRWTFDVQEILSSTMATENVVSLLKNKMKSLPSDTRRVLPIMACLGSTFCAPVFDLVANGIDWSPEPEESTSDQDQADPEQHHPPANESMARLQITRCEVAGLIESCRVNGVESYHWVHDKIHEAAFSFLNDTKLQALKLQIGLAMFQGMDFPSLDAHIFTVANLLQAESIHGTNSSFEQPLDIAKLYHRAATKAIESSAYEQACEYLATGLQLLPPGHWQRQYNLSLALYSTAAEASFCSGDFENTRIYSSHVICQENVPLIDKRRAFNALLDSHQENYRCYTEAFSLCESILSQLGHSFPNRFLSLRVASGIFRMKARLRQYTASEKVLQLPALQNAETLWVLSLLDKLISYAYMVKPELLPLLIFKGIQITIGQGINDHAPVMFAYVGFLFSAVIQDFNGGLAFADQSIKLLEHVQSKKVEARVLMLTHTFVFHGMRHLKLSIKPLLRSYEVGMATGDTESAALSIYYYLEYSFRTGTSLSVLSNDFAFYAEQLRQVKQLKILSNLFKVLWQTVLHLTGVNRFTGTITGEVLNQEEAQQEASTDDAKHLFASFNRMQMYLAFVFGQHQLVHRCIRRTGMHLGSYLRLFPGIVGLYHLYAFNGLSMISLYRDTGEEKYLRLARKFASKIKFWAKSGVRGLLCGTRVLGHRDPLAASHQSFVL